MWLLGYFAGLSRAALRTFYRFERAGGEVPSEGPLLLVANHPNSLLDPAAVCSVARRPVRFLAKAPLFGEPLIGRIVRGCGAIPVHRRQDDATQMHRNEEAFRAAYAALAAGDAVGIFPEGLSHSEPALAPLRTGAARIALGGAALRGTGFPIVPVGLVLRRKERFRSRALVVVGKPVPWADLQAAGSEDETAARSLTERIEEGLRRVTVNLERWEDAPVVECAEAIYAAEFALPFDRALRVRRLREVSGALTALRREDPERLQPVYRAIARYADLLRLAGVVPHRLDRDPSPGAALRWTLRQLVFFVVLAPVAALGVVLFAVPYRLTGLLPERAGAPKDVQSTWKVLGGIAIYGIWIALLVVVAAWLARPPIAVATAMSLPLLGLVTVAVRDRWEEARRSARAWFLLRRKGDLRRRLLERRRLLAERLEALRRELEGGPPSGAARAV